MTDRTLLTNDERADLATRLPGWRVDGDHLRCSWAFTDFAEAFAFMTQVADIAEALQHHPDWSNSWNRVEIAVTTHFEPPDRTSFPCLDLAFAEAVDALL